MSRHQHNHAAADCKVAYDGGNPAFHCDLCNPDWALKETQPKRRAPRKAAAKKTAAPHK